MAGFKWRFGLRAKLLVLVGLVMPPVIIISYLPVSARMVSVAITVGMVLLLVGLWLVTAGWVRQRAELIRVLQLRGVSCEKMHDREIGRFMAEALQMADKGASERLDSYADQVSATADDVINSVALTNQGVSHLKTETETLNQAMQEMLVSAQTVSSNAQDASHAATDAEANARHGQEILNQTASSIDTLSGQVENSSNVIKELAKDSDNIGAILDVIKGIAEQTNLLALNAAIEAARAGEQGRGFAVVADEVRSLASRTHESTQEIETMIQRLQQAAQSAVSSMDGGQEISRQSVEQVGKASASLNAITVAVEHIRNMNAQIASAAEKQSVVTADIKANVEVIDDVNDLAIETLGGLNSIGETLVQLVEEMRTNRPS